MNLSQCHLIRPEAVGLLLPVALLLWWAWRRYSLRGSWSSVCDPVLLPHILQGREGKRPLWPYLILGLAAVMAILALSGPACEQRPQPVFRDQSALVIALDLSHSMDAADLKPSRLARARLKLVDILKQRREGQTALLVYAAQAYTISPLTDDTNTILAQISALETNLLPEQGSRVSAAIAKANQLLQQAGVPKGEILLISDGIGEVELAAARELLQKGGHRLSVIGVGTAGGGPIPLQGGGFLKDSSGSIVIPKLDSTPLKQLALAGGGRYTPISLDDRDINSLLGNLERQQSEAERQSLKSDQWREEGPWLLLALLPLAALAFRRGYLIVLVPLLILPLPRESQALDLQGLWLNADQQAHQQLEAGKAAEAARRFNDPSWKAAAHYQAGEYEEALKQLQGATDSEALYNKGNALARLGRFDEALKAYDQALKQDPQHEDARYNRDLVRQQQQNQQQQNQSQSGQQDKENQQQQSNQSQQQADQGQQGEQQQGQQQDQQKGQQQDASSKPDQQNPAQDPQQQGDEKQQAEAKRDDQGDKQQDAAKQQAEAQKAGKEEGEPESEQQQAQRQEYSEVTESDIATQQWLRRIPDDPGGLLRRKFQYQYQQSQQQRDDKSQPW